MDKKLAFLLGVLTGGAAGATAAYFFARNYFIDHYNIVLDQYAEDCKKKIQEIEDYYEDNLSEAVYIAKYKMKDGEENQGLDPEVANNDGVKKYHHYAGGFAEDSAQKIFSQVKTEDEEVTEGEKALKADVSLDDIPGIEEITEDDFLNDEENDPVTLDYDFNEDKLYWGYGTDNEVEAEIHFSKLREEIIGKIWRWATDYIKDPDEGTGAAYVRNTNLGKIFEVIMHFDPTQPVVEVER